MLYIFQISRGKYLLALVQQYKSNDELQQQYCSQNNDRQ